MGAAKSQLLIPHFALFGASVESLRLATMLWALGGVLLAMLWARGMFGPGVAMLLGPLVALDPSVLFVARHDWGSFSLGLLCRGGALMLLTAGWRRSSLALLAAGGFCLGVGIYNKIDFAVFVIAAALALVVAAPGVLRELLGRRRWQGLAAALGAALGAGPMLASLGGALAATRLLSRGRGEGASDWAEKLSAVGATIDGSYFERLMRSGGSFERLAGVEGAVATPQLVLLVLAVLVLAVCGIRDHRRGRPGRATVFVLLTTALTLAGILATPRAVRIHHFLNVVPFPQLVIATALVEIWRRAGRGLGRTAATALAVVAVAGALRADFATLSAIEESGGRGRWSAGVAALGRSLEALPGASVVCTDWGFGEPLRLVAPRLEISEPFWQLRRPRATAPALEGDADDLYLAWEPAYAVFPFGTAMLEAVAALPAGAAEVRHHADRSGDPAFVSVRFARPHRLAYRGGRVEVQLR
jgi:hypothetical protein